MNRKLKRILFFFASIVTLVGFIHAEKPSNYQVIKAFESGMQSDGSFETIYRFVVGDVGEAKWRQINWHSDLMKARKIAQESSKPLFIWTMNGDPLGCV